MAQVCEAVNRSIQSVDPKTLEVVDRELGDWFVDWLKYSGYHTHNETQMYKQLIMTAFPKIKNDREYSPENLETSMLNYARLLRTYSHIEEETDNSNKGRMMSVLALTKTA